MAMCSSAHRNNVLVYSTKLTDETMVRAEPESRVTKASPRMKGWLLLFASAVLLVIAWLTAQLSLVSKGSAIEDVSVSNNVIVVGAVPWFLQWAGVTCAILACCGSRRTPGASVFTIATSFTFAIVWWGGLAIYFRGMDPLDTMLDVTMFEIRSQFGVSSTFGEILFHFIGPIVGPIQLHGPIILHGWNFPLAVLSTSLLVGYLLFVGRVCRVGIWPGHFRPKDWIRFVVAILPCFLPPFIRLAIQVVHTR